MDLEKLHELKNKCILVFGDCMVDQYLDGEVNRISPEAPVPVIQIKNRNQKLGGAGNVINNLITLGANVKLLGFVGDDIPGNFIMNSFQGNQSDISYLKKYAYIKTTIKTRVVSKKQQFIRMDEEQIQEAPTDYQQFIETNIEEILDSIDVVVISDYNKGAVTKKLAQFLIQEAKKRKVPVLVDPKGTDYNKYSGATFITPNTKELSMLVGKPITTELEIEDHGHELCKKYQIDYLILTRSEKGISIVQKGKPKQDFKAVAKDVIDVSGAGDTVVATMAVLQALEFSVEDSCIISNIAASVVVSKFGTSTVSLNELMTQFYNDGEFKLIHPNTAKYIIQDLRKKGKKIVFTNGCFDLIHPGHLASLKKAKSLGDVLVVAINSDASVKRLKGPKRPILSEENRIEMLCSLECVDYVILMEDDTPVNLINLIHPDISIKGMDWKDKMVPEKPVIESYGGHIEFIELEKGLSTSNIIDKIRRVYDNE